MTIQQQFEVFHNINPWVYTDLVQLARQAKATGRRTFGIKSLYEVVRWNRFIQTTDPNDDSWKLNNNYHSRYARLIMDQEPDLKGFFNVRELKAA